MIPSTHLRPLIRAARLAALAAVLALPGCESLLRRTPPGQQPQPSQRLTADVVRVLDVDEPSPAFYRRRARLEVMGPELDRVLEQVIDNRDTKDNVRANAVTLLADRAGPGSAAVLRRVLIERGDDAVRAAAAAGLQRFVADSPAVKAAIRASLRDPSERVRLAALQGMDVEDVEYIRAMVPREENRQVRAVARQLLTLFEARGAPLLRDPRGDLRTTGDDSVPRIVFHPTGGGTANGAVAGGLWVELPGGRQLVPLAPHVEVVGDVVPAFFDSQRRVVVFEGDGQVQVRDLRTGTTRTVGPGIAPRPIPFTDRFVFLRGPAAATGEAEYTVLRSTFAGGEAEPIGTLRATLRAARTLVVGEAADGFVLRGEGVTTFVLPGPYGQ